MALKRFCDACGRVLAAGERCPCRGRPSDHRRKPGHEFYDSVQWRRLAEAARARAGGVDEYLARYEHRLTPASLVHHIVPADEDPARRLDPANLVVLSPAVHRRVHDAYAAGPAEKRRVQALLRAIRADSEEVNPDG